jgi:hypothetical protein
MGRAARRKVHARIHVAESELQGLAERLASEEVTRDRELLMTVSQQYQETETRIRELYAKWEEALELAAK